MNKNDVGGERLKLNHSEEQRWGEERERERGACHVMEIIPSASGLSPEPRIHMCLGIYIQEDPLPPFTPGRFKSPPSSLRLSLTLQRRFVFFLWSHERQGRKCDAAEVRRKTKVHRGHPETTEEAEEEKLKECIHSFSLSRSCVLWPKQSIKHFIQGGHLAPGLG